MTVLMTGFPGFLASALLPDAPRSLLPPTRLWRVACTWWTGTSPSQGLASTGAAWTT